jgi:hypothetical protein
LIIALRKAGKRTLAPLLEFLKDRESASFEEVAEQVFEGDQTEDATIRQAISRLNKELVEKQVPLHFRVESGYVYKEIQSR